MKLTYSFWDRGEKIHYFDMFQRVPQAKRTVQVFKAQLIA